MKCCMFSVDICRFSERNAASLNLWIKSLGSRTILSFVVLTPEHSERGRSKYAVEGIYLVIRHSVCISIILDGLDEILDETAKSASCMLNQESSLKTPGCGPKTKHKLK